MKHYYYWLIPDPPHRERLQQIILQFSQVYGGSSFVPHITMGSGAQIPTDLPKELKAPTLLFSGLYAEDFYFRALYCTCHPNEDIQKIRTYLNGETPFDPHLSLVYGEHSAARRRDWCTHTPLYPQLMRFSELWIVQGGANISNWTPIKKYCLATE